MSLLPVLRRSAIQTAKSCLYRYDKIWRQGVSDMSDPALKGIAFHACAHKYIERLIATQLPSDEEEARAAFVEGIATALTPAHLVPEVRMIYMGWARHFALDTEAFVASEERQVGGEEHAFAPDLVYARPEGLEIVDFKTFWQPWTETQVREDWQARWYMFNAMRIWKHFPAYRFTHSYVRLGSVVSVLFAPSDVEGFADEVAAVAATITEAEERGEWPATAGPDCAYCTLACPLVDNTAIVPQRIQTLAQREMLASRILAGKAWICAAEKTLKQDVAANGPCTVNGMVFDNRPAIQRLYPVAKVLEVLQARNIAGAFEQEGLTVSHSALAKLLKQFPALEDDLAPYVQSKTVYRFSSRKPGVRDDDDE